jgi:hypothetical protein
LPAFGCGRHLAALLLFALSIRTDELYARSFAPGQEATEWTD